MGHADPGGCGLTRRGFLEWGAGLLAAVALPGAALLLTEGSAAAAASPYALATWMALDQRSVQASAPGRASVALKVVGVTNLAGRSTTPMVGDVFSVVFGSAKAMTSGIYTLSAATLGSVALFVDAVDASTIRLVINRRLPVR